MNNTAPKVIRDKNSAAAIFLFQGQGPWKLYAGPSAGEIDETQPIAQGLGSGETTLELTRTRRAYFLLEAEGKKTTLAERVLPLQGGYNFRDLGGYATKDGRRVKWGTFIRSDDLGHLTEEDLRYLSSVPVKTVVDFRADDEVAYKPDRFPESMTKNFFCPIDPGNVLSLIKTGRDALTVEGSEETMMLMTAELVLDATFQEKMRFFFSMLMERERLPVVYHCSAGKDRTGLASALILSALEVTRETIYEDFLLSNSCLEGKYERYIQSSPEIRPLFEVRRKNLEAAFERIETLHGTVENYLVNVIKADLPTLRNRFLE